ncbi:hypothetical protein DPU24_16640 [Salmonella enterica subsp. enterica serovar Oranienburg]|nr:hypothetical protein [Salmonella enterica subsp. enterica serovar Oranienburg]
MRMASGVTWKQVQQRLRSVDSDLIPLNTSTFWHTLMHRYPLSRRKRRNNRVVGADLLVFIRENGSRAGTYSNGIFVLRNENTVVYVLLRRKWNVQK